MDKNQYIQFANAALNIIIQDIMEVDIIIPKLVFDYSTNPNINTGYYMYQNITGDIITINMNSIESLRVDDDIKTVTTYGFIHEIMHMFQAMSSRYRTDKEFYTIIEDNADRETIRFIRDNLNGINRRLHFKFNEVFLLGIERQLKNDYSEIDYYSNKSYICKAISGALCNKLNINFDYIYTLLLHYEILLILIPDNRNIYLDLIYATSHELNLILNSIYLSEFKIIKINPSNEESYSNTVVLKLY